MHTTMNVAAKLWVARLMVSEFLGEEIDNDRYHTLVHAMQTEWRAELDGVLQAYEGINPKDLAKVDELYRDMAGAMFYHNGNKMELRDIVKPIKSDTLREKVLQSSVKSKYSFDTATKSTEKYLRAYQRIEEKVNDSTYVACDNEKATFGNICKVCKQMYEIEKEAADHLARSEHGKKLWSKHAELVKEYEVMMYTLLEQTGKYPISEDVLEISKNIPVEYLGLDAKKQNEFQQRLTAAFSKFKNNLYRFNGPFEMDFAHSLISQCAYDAADPKDRKMTRDMMELM